MSTIDLGKDINATIVAAVNAKITAETFAALSNDETLGKFVTAALTQKIEVDRYGPKVPYINHVLESAIQKATKVAVEEWMLTNEQVVKDKVKELLEANIDNMAGALVGSATEEMKARYGMQIKIDFQKTTRY